MGKKKDKDKVKDKAKGIDSQEERPGRKDLVREVARLQAQNEALRARLERIAEIAAADPDTASVDPSIAVLDTEDE